MKFDNDTLRTAVQLYLENRELAIQQYGHIGTWNVSNVTDMSYVFRDAETFNQDIGNWDVSNVTNISCMFYNAKNFNQDINNWDINNITKIDRMFYNTLNFKQNIRNLPNNTEQSTILTRVIGYCNQSITTLFDMFNTDGYKKMKIN